MAKNKKANAKRELTAGASAKREMERGKRTGSTRGGRSPA